MESKTKNKLKIAVACVAGAVAIAGVGLFAYYVSQPAHKAELEQAEMLEANGWMVYQAEGYDDYVQWWNDLAAHKAEWMAGVDGMLADYDAYMDDATRQELADLRADMEMARSFEEMAGYEAVYSEIYNRLSESKAEADAIAAQQAQAEQQQASYSGGGGGYYASGYSNDFMRDGVVYSNGTRYTWYSSNTLHHYRTDEWTPNGDGFYTDSDGYLVVASDDHAQGSVVDTPWGQGKVYDSGCGSGTIDMYTDF